MADQDTRTQVVLLGTGTPNAEPDRAGSSLAVIVNDRPYLVDMGPGIVRRANAAYQTGIQALAMPNLTTAFLTHLHTDHTLGYADLIFTPWVLERHAPLTVYGPRGLKAMTRHLMAAYQADVQERLGGLEPANPGGFQVIVREVTPGLVHRDENVTVRAFAVSHGSWPAYGYRFESADRTVVVSGDTAPTEELAAHYAGCDVLIHEVYSTAGFAGRPPAWQRYHASVHTSTAELAAIAQAVQPGLLVLVHQLTWGVDEAALIAEIRAAGYHGDVISGRDLDVI